MSSADKNPNRVAGGLKATIHNPNMREETKDNAVHRLQEMGVEENETGDTSRGVSYDKETEVDELENDVEPEYIVDQETKNRSMGGYKATLKNPNVSKEAKAHAKEVLKENDAI